MSQHFKVNVNNAFHFEIDKKEASELDASNISNTKFHVLYNNSSFKTEIIESNFNSKSYKVKVNNNHHNINILSGLDVLINDMGFELGSSKQINNIKAPMPGLILDISIKVGQEVKENDALLVLEAMKMENVLTSPRGGIIKTISINKGDTVEKNQLLIEFSA